MAQIEITTKIGCPINCTYCPQKKTVTAYKKKSNLLQMSFDVFKRCIDNVPKKVEIIFSGFCEPWLNPECTKMVLYAHKKGHVISVYTTLIGMTLTDIDLLESIPFRVFIVHLPFNKKNENIKIDEQYLALLSKISQSRIDPNYIGIHIREEEPALKQILKVLKGKEIDHEIANTRASNLDETINSPPLRKNGKISCPRNLRVNILLPNGDVVLCCMDFGLRHTLGNLLNSDYKSLFRGKELARIKKGLIDDTSDILCRYCEYCNSSSYYLNRLFLPNPRKPAYTIYINESIWAQPDIEVVNKFADYLNKKDLEVTIKQAATFELKSRFFSRKKLKFSPACIFIQNNESGYFYVLNFDVDVVPYDKRLKNILLDSRCMVFLKNQYRESAYNKYPFTKIKPWTFFAARPQEMQLRLETYRRVKRIRPSLYFRGEIRYKRRGDILVYLKKKGIINPDSKSISYHQYLKECCQYKIILSLPGWGNLCHREIEGFGLGTPVLMPRLKNSLHNDLKPDFHYISVDSDMEEDSLEYIADKIEERFHQVIGRQEYLDFLAGNAIQWYDANVRYPNSMELTARLLGLIK